MSLKKNSVMLGRASLSDVWWVIFENILHSATKQDMNSLWPQKKYDKGNQKGIALTSFTWFIATVSNNVLQILLNPPRGVFSITFQQASDRPTYAEEHRFGYLVRLFSSSTWSDRVYLGWFVWDLVGRLFRMQAGRRSVKGSPQLPFYWLLS